MTPRRRAKLAAERFVIRRYTVAEDGPYAAEYVDQKRRAEGRQAQFDALDPKLRATVNAVGDTALARDLARKNITSHRQAERVKAEIAWRSLEAFGD